MMSYWKRVDERLIKRGMLIMDLDFLRSYRDELSDVSSPMVGYGRRWMAETAISRFKALFGEHLLSRKPRWMDSELRIKAFIYNMLLSAVTT